MREKRACVYILASRRNRTLSVGVTTDLARRMFEHRSRAVTGFTRRYGVDRLVDAEFHDSIEAAILEARSHRAR